MTDIIKLGFALIIAGFALLFIGSFLSAGNAGFGGLIMIGPIPVVFGTSPEMAVIAMALGLVMMLLYFILRRKYA